MMDTRFGHSLALLLAAGALAALAGCGPDRAPPLPQWHQDGDHRWRELHPAEGDGPGFRALEPGRTGVDFRNGVPDTAEYRNRVLAQGSGVAVGDVNGDSRLDLYFASAHGRNALYLNRGGMRFEEVTDSAGVALPDHVSTGVALADVEGDGDLDLLVAGLGQRTRLLLNDGEGRFTDATVGSGLDAERGSSTLTLADVDGDGDLDLYVTNYREKMVWDAFPDRSLDVDSVTRRVGGELEVKPAFRDFCELTVEDGEPACRWVGETDELYLNDGTGHFRRVSFTSGRFLDEDGDPLSEPPRDWGLAARFYDLNRDGAPDLWVANDFESPERIWLNRGDGTFRAAPRLAVRTTSMSSMAVDFADIDRDGDVDVFTSDMEPLPGPHTKSQRHARSEYVPPGALRMRIQKSHNVLLMNRGDDTFAEIAHAAGVEASGWTWGTMFVDVDLDGYEDLLLANGHEWDQLDGDSYARRRRAGDVSWQAKASELSDLDLRNVAYRNRGDRTFERVGERWDFGVEADVSHGIARGDLDGDGDPDVVVTRLNRPAVVYENVSTAPRLVVRLRGRAPNTRAIGARVAVRGGPAGVQSDQVTAGGMYLSSSAPELTFAAGRADTLEVAVRWPGGGRTVLDDVRPGRLYEIRQPPADTADADGGARAGGEAGGGPTAGGDPTPALSFTNATAALGGHEHTERVFNDFNRQPLLPLQLSRLGPGMTWADVDRDGDPDLLVGTGAGGRVALFRNRESGFRRVPLGLDTARYDRSTLLPLPDSEGGTDLLVGQMNYEADSPVEGRSLASVLRLDPGRADAVGRTDAAVEPVVDGIMSTTGPLAAADYDGDGDLDLFVGGRVIPTGYPAAATSRLFLNEDGSFVPDTANNALLESIGLVSAALFSDQDGDGDPDLLLATEWGPLQYFRNEDGRFVDATAEVGLDTLTGRWNGVNAGDFDGDGRLDLVLTGWGTNTRYGPAEKPLHVYYGFFGGPNDPRLDVVVARRQEWTGGIAPLFPFYDVASEIPVVQERVKTFAGYARATVEEALGPETVKQGRHAVARRLRHLVLLNRGGNYEVRPLPPMAQYAPAFHAGVADADGDGHEDIFLTQNYFAVRRGLGWYAAGRSLWLLGDGKGDFEPVPGHRSGVTVYGDPRGAALADYDGDGRVDLAVSQNGGRTLLFRNRGARAGLRVHLDGPPGNPRAVGAEVRLVYEHGPPGPVRELHLGSGYWSVGGAVPVLGVEPGRTPTGVRVEWPGGRTTSSAIEPGQREIELSAPGG